MSQEDRRSAEQELSLTLRQFLRRRYRLLAAEHDDLIQQSLEDFLRFRAARPLAPLPESEWPAIALTILKRRVADRFREATLRATTSVAQMEDDDPHLIDAGASVDEIVRFRRLLATVLKLIAELPAADQALLLDEVAMPPQPDGAVSATDRKRLSRLRERLREKMQRKFGVKPEDYFGR